MLRADAGIIEAGRDGMAFEDLAVVVLQQIGAVAVQHAGLAAGHRRRMPVRHVEPVAAGLDPDHRDRGIVEKRVEQAHRVGAAADAGDQRVGQAPLALQHLLARSSRPITDWKSRTMAG